MSDRGGRTRWQRALAGGGLAATLMVVVGGCGGRTVALDQSIYGADDDDDGVVGGKGGGGAGNVAGKPNTAGSPSGGATGFNPSQAVGPCKSYCPGYASQCAERLEGQDCVTSCQAELNGFGARCQQLGIIALGCLQPFFTVGAGNCDAAVNTALLVCGKLVTDFQECKGVTTPTPTMPSTPKDVTTCSSTSTASPSSCQAGYKCNSGTYQVACMNTGDGQVAVCGCLGPNGEMAGGTFPATNNPCPAAARSLCTP